MIYQKLLRKTMALVLVVSSLAGCSTPLPATATPTPAPPTPASTPFPPTAPTTPTVTPTAAPIATPVSTLAPTPIPTAVGDAVQLIQEPDERFSDVAWSPDGQTLAVASQHAVYLYGTETLAEQAHREMDGLVLRVAWPPSGKGLFMAGDGLHYWKVGGEQVEQLGTGTTWDVAVASDGKLIACSFGSEEGGYRAWIEPPGGWLMIETSEPVSEGSGPEWADPDTARLVVVYDIAIGEPRYLWRGHAPGSNVRALAWSPDGKRLATGSEDGTVIIWDVASGEQQHQLGGQRGFTGPITILGVAWSPDGTRLASGGSALVIWDVENETILHTLDGHTKYVSSVAWSPDGRQLASASHDNSVIIWDTASGRALCAFDKHTDAIWGVAWSPDGAQVASASWDGSAWVWGALFCTSERVYQ